MKKSFFKKLSFVLALAMIVSVVAPAAGAFAAADPTINKAKQYLFLGEKNTYDFHVDNKIKGSTYEWASDNEAVATVDSVGLTTAKKVGTAIVSLLVTDKKGNTYPSEATVVVKDNIKTVAITGKPANDTVAVGAENDFGRSFTTQGGSSTKTTSVTRWVVTDADGKATDKATIDASTGLFKATVAGTYKVTANAFQSTEKYEAWKTSGTGVQATDTATVTVKASVVATKQVDADTFTVEFDSDMSKTDFATAVVLYQVVGDNTFTTGAEKIKKVSYDATGKIATVDVYAEVNGGNTYKFVAGDLTGSFKAAKKSVDEVKTIVFDDVKVNISDKADLLLSVKGLDANGVVVATGAALAGKVEFKYGGDFTKGFTSGNYAYIYTEGYSTTITANFKNYIYDDTQKKYVEVTSTDSAIATGVKTDTTLTAGTLSYIVDKTTAVKTSAATGWGSSFSLPAGDGVFYTHFRYLTNDVTNGTYKYDDGKYTFTSNDPDKLLVTGTTMVPVSKGTVTVIVKTNDTNATVVGTFTVNVVDTRAFAGATSDIASTSLGNTTTAGITESKSFVITAKDTLNEVISSATINPASIVYNARPASGATLNFVVDDTATDGTVKLTVNAAGATPGAYSCTAKVSALGTEKDVPFTVVILSAADLTVARWAPELDTTAVDTKDVVAAKTVGVSVYGYNAAGAKVAVLNNAQFGISVLLNGTTVTSHVTSDLVTDSVGIVAPNATTPTTLDFYAPGTYAVTVSVTGANSPTGKVDTAVLGYLQFSITDTSTSSVAIVASSVTASDATTNTVEKAVLAAFDFTVNGTVVDANTANFAFYTSNGTSAVGLTAGNAAVTAGTTLYIDKVTYTVTTAGLSKVYTIDVKKTIAVK